MTALRKSRPGDVRGLRKLWEIVFGPEEAFTEVFFREMYRPGSAAVAEENGVIVSAAYGVDFGTDRYIYAVGTRPDHRGRGISRKMLEVLMCEARREGVQAFTLEVRAGNAVAVNLYESLGFRTEGVRPRFYDDPVEDGLIMWQRPENAPELK